MTIKYCSWATGNDTTGNGSNTLPYKTIDKASTGLTGGDEVRVEKSPDPTALTGTIAFTQNSTTITGTNTLFTTELAIGDFIEDGDGYWLEVVTITNNTSALLNQKYSSATQSGVSSRKLGITSTGAAAASTTAVQTVSSSGSSSQLTISGGWDLSTQTQTGKTYFRQMNATFSNRYGYGLYFSSKSNVSISNLGFLRYNTGVYMNSSSKNTFTDVVCNSNSNNGFYLTNLSYANILYSVICVGNSGKGLCIDSASLGTRVVYAICNSNGSYGLYINAAENTYVDYAVCNENVNYGVYVNNSDMVTFNYLECKYCDATFKVWLTYSTIKIIGTFICDGIVILDHSPLYINKGSVSGWGGYGDYSLTTAFINNSSSTGYAYIKTDGGNIVSQAATGGGTGKEWKLSPTSANRDSFYPLVLPIAKIAVASSSQVTVSVYFKKSHATGIGASLRCRFGQITWSETQSDIITNCPNDTNRNQVSLQFNPTESGIVEIEATAWYISGTTYSVLIDDITVSQA